ncbi:MAG: protein arginine kinase [Defluviitaleaceae bacterium]|nr:protein arginine kinase [Defluviitaleaceae bacterium]
MAAWYQDLRTDNGPIISARVRLARNVTKYPFRTKLSEESAKDMIAEATAAIKDDHTEWANQIQVIDPATYTENDKRMFLEKHIISPEFIKNDLPKGLLLQNDFNVSIMINEEDHIRIQTISPGDDINASWEMANRIDDLIEESLEFAFDKEYGYLTACPTNVGTGMRASFMIHLPMLEKTGQLKNMLPAISKFGIAVRGLYGEGSESMGGIFQISNQVTLGKSEQDIIQGVQSVAKNLIDKELWLRDKMMDKHRLDIENNIFRSYGILTYGRKATVKEAMDMLSEIRLGYALGILDLPKPYKNIYQIMMEIQPGHLLWVAEETVGKILNETEQDIMRADHLRRNFSRN